MGYLMIDHRCTEGVELINGAAVLTGKDGRLVEMDTVACEHCQAVIKIVLKGVNRAYDTKHSCPKCVRPICNSCAEAMHVSGGVCPGPVLAQIHRALDRRRAGESVTLSPGQWRL